MFATIVPINSSLLILNLVLIKEDFSGPIVVIKDREGTDT
jgi:hypothetical protein